MSISSVSEEGFVLVHTIELWGQTHVLTVVQRNNMTPHLYLSLGWKTMTYWEVFYKIFILFVTSIIYLYTNPNPNLEHSLYYVM